MEVRCDNYSGQRITLMGKQLRENVQIRDASRNKRYLIESKIELSYNLFERNFEDGKIVFVRLEDLTGGQEIIGELFHFNSRIFYSQSNAPIVITLGNDQGLSVRDKIKHLEHIWNEDFGRYVISWEKVLEQKDSKPFNEH